MPHDGRPAVHAWSLDDIYSARQEQMLGQFWRPARMAEQMRTDDALAVAYENRLAPQRCIPVEIVAKSGALAEKVAGEARALYGNKGLAIHPDTLADVHGCLVNHGVAFAILTAVPREDGSRVDYLMNYWPIEFVRWDSIGQTFLARVDPETVQDGDLHKDDVDLNGKPINYSSASGTWVPIIHGDGRWVVFKKHEIDPFRQAAAILPAALVWARHAFAVRDWAKGSVAHGNAKVIGAMAPGVPLQKDGALTDDARAFLDLLKAIGTADAPCGIKPAGSEIDFLTNNSTAWQVWSELVNNGEKAAARIYLGTDGVLGSNGGAPGVDITALFGVASTKVRGDLECIQRGIDTGVIEPWCAINFGDSKLAPSRQYLIPNEDENALRDNTAKRNKAFYELLAAAKNAGLTLAPEYVAALAEDLGVRVPTFVTPAPVQSLPPR
jgi:hypothetical protein